jgi:hypothetical protein
MAKSALDELLARVEGKPAPVRRKIVEEVQRATAHMAWVPNPGPQTDAYLSKADILLYGGQAGGGKSNLLIGWGVNESEIGIIFRRELTQTDGLEADGKQVIGTDGWNGSDHEWTRPDGRTLKLAGMRDADSWMAHAGRERDFYGYDEAGEFLEVQIASLFAWLRSKPGRRTRVILASNPPRTSDGYWMIDWFGPWIDDQHPLYPTPPGELRFAVYIAQDLLNRPGQLVWVDGPGNYEINGETYTARSYTFIPASLEDNPYRNTPEYRAQLQNLPEPLRSQLLKGDFKAGLADNAYQVIPSAWVRAAQQRWRDRIPEIADTGEQVPMCAIGVDPSGGGQDDMVMAPRHDSWFASLVKIAGKDLPKDRMSTYAAGQVVTIRRNGATPVIDLGGGYGNGIYEHLTANDVRCVGYKGAAGTTRRTKDGKLKFHNTRSAAYWAMREALDPDQPGGSNIALPPDKRLAAGLCAPTYSVGGDTIKVEPKSKNEGGTKGVVERLGWSPNEADAVVMAWWAGPKMASHASDWLDHAQGSAVGRSMRGMQPKVVLGHQAARRRR